MKAQRIAIWGNSGSGKSTLAEQLAAAIRLPSFHVDQIAWHSGWRYTDEATFLQRHRQWIEQPAWIIEGVGRLSGIRERFSRADLILFLDTPAELCRARATRRIEEDRSEQNRFIAEGCRYGDVVEEQWRVIEDFDQHLRGEISSMIAAQFSSKPYQWLDGRNSSDVLCGEVTRMLAPGWNSDAI